MCGRYSLAVSPEELEQIFDAPAEGTLALPRWNIAPMQDAPVVVESRVGRRIRPLRWGLVPYWAEDPRVGARHINARAETLATTSPFRDAFARRRCLVPADGFYEWSDRPGGGPRLPHWVHHRRGGVLAFAGLCERWRAHGSRGRLGGPRETEPLRYLHDHHHRAQHRRGAPSRPYACRAPSLRVGCLAGSRHAAGGGAVPARSRAR